MYLLRFLDFLVDTNDPKMTQKMAPKTVKTENFPISKRHYTIFVKFSIDFMV